MKNGIKRFGAWLGRHRKGIFVTLVFAVVLAGTAAYSYQLGEKQGKKTVPKTTDFASMFSKNLSKKLAGDQPAKTPATTSINNSGFFRFTGTVQKIDKTTLTIKIENGSVMNLQLKDGQTYLQNGKQQPVAGLKRNTTIVTTGSIKNDGSFAPTVIQAK